MLRSGSRLVHRPLGCGVAVALSAALLGACGPRGPDDVCDPFACPTGTECDLATGACAPIACTPGQTRCSPSEVRALERCSATGDEWARVGACTADQTCDPEGTALGAACTPEACTPGSTLCADGAVRYCVVGAFEDPVMCPSGEVCDEALGSTCVPTVCGPGTWFCAWDPDAVRMCNELGSASTVIEVCPPGTLCSNGVCYTHCDLAQLGRAFEGCVYYPLDTNNVSHDDPLQYEVLVTNRTEVAADVTIEARDGTGGPWTAVSTGMVAPGAASTFELPDRHAEGTAMAPGLAYRLTSSVPVMAFQVSSNDVAAAAASSGGSLLLARSGLSSAHLVMTLPSSTGSDALFDFGGEIHSGGFAIVGAFDGTVVTVTVTAPTIAGPGIPPLAAGDSYTLTLNEGDVWQVEAASVGDDLTGSYVDSTADVAVFGYHECATLDPGTCDHFEEQLLGRYLWGTLFAGARFVAAGTTQLWRILAAEDGTSVTYEYGAGTTGLPGPSGSVFALDAGEWQDLYVTGPPPLIPGAPAAADLVLWADHAVLVAQFSTGEVHMALAPPEDWWSAAYLLVAGPGFDDGISVARFSSAIISLDGAIVPAAEWTSISPSYDAWRTTVADGTHTLTGIAVVELQGPPGVWLSGEGASAGYAYPGGLYQTFSGRGCAGAPRGAAAICVR